MRWLSLPRAVRSLLEVLGLVIQVLSFQVKTQAEWQSSNGACRLF